MTKSVSEAIIKTLCYAEVFSYPLNFLELHKYLMYHKKISKQELLFELRFMNDMLKQEGEYITFVNTTHFVKTRKERQKESKRKMGKAMMVASFLSYIPTIKLIGISGSLSMQNSKKEDDIDFFFITSKNTLWITRFFVTLFLVCFKQKRDRMRAITKDKICPNMFLSEEALVLPVSFRNIYTAHEVSQVKVIYAKDHMDSQFFSANRWVLKYLPHAFSYKKQKPTKRKFYTHLLFPFEIFAYGLQYAYMKRRITNEKINLSRAMFHPRKSKEIICDIYNLKVLYRTGEYMKKNKVFGKSSKLIYN